MVDQQRSPAAVADGETNSLYEAAFSTTGRHPQAGIAVTRTVAEARQRLADMLVFCHPAAPATADIVEFTRAQTVAHHTGTAADLFAEFNGATPARTVIAGPLTAPATAEQ